MIDVIGTLLILGFFGWISVYAVLYFEYPEWFLRRAELKRLRKFTKISKSARISDDFYPKTCYLMIETLYDLRKARKLTAKEDEALSKEARAQILDTLNLEISETKEKYEAFQLEWAKKVSNVNKRRFKDALEFARGRNDDDRDRPGDDGSE